LGAEGCLRGRLIDDGEESTVKTLQRFAWCRPSTCWISATPIALSRHPGSLRRGSAAKRAAAWRQAEELVARECAFIGLPEPLRVRVDFAPMLAGASPAPAFPAF